MATAAELQARDKVFIGGEWVEPQATETLEVINSSTEEVIGTIPACTPADADRAVLAAREAFESWSQTSREERAGYLAAIAAGLGERSEEIAATISQELGMPLKLSQLIQAGLPTGQFAAMPGLMEEVAWEEEIGNSRVLREPVGVLGAITPWNYPLNQIAAKVAPALAAGCTVVLKPSEVVPLNAFILAEMIEAAGLPAGRLQHGHRHRARGRRGDRRPPRRRHGLLHRLDPGRPARLRARLGDGQAGGDGAGRQVAERDPRRRRPGAGDPRRRRQVLPQLGPDLQRPDPDAGPAREARRGRGDRRAGRRGIHARRSLRRGDPARAARLRRAARARARLHREGRGRRGEAAHRRRRRARGPRSRLLRPPHRLLRGDHRDDDRPGGDLRAGPRDPALRGRGRRGADRQRQRLRPRRRRLVGRPGPRDRRRPPHPHRPDRDQRRRLQPARPVRRLQAVRATAARTAATPSRSCCRSSRCSCSRGGRAGPSPGGGALLALRSLRRQSTGRPRPPQTPRGGGHSPLAPDTQ